MSVWEHRALWVAIGLILLLLANLTTAVERCREELDQFRQHMMGEKTERIEDF